MNGEFYNIGIEDNLNRDRIRVLLTWGVIASVMTGTGDFILGYATETEMPNMAAQIMSTAPNLADWQLIAGGLLGLFGILLEGLAYFAIYRLMAETSAHYAHIYRTGIIGYIWLAPIGCHLNMGLLNMAFKYLLQADPEVAYRAAKPLYYGFALPVYILLVCFWLPMIIIQFKAFDKGLTPYPRYAKWFNVIVGGVPAILIGLLIGNGTALGGAVCTIFLSVGNLLTFGGLLATLPSEERFEEFRKEHRKSPEGYMDSNERSMHL